MLKFFREQSTAVLLALGVAGASSCEQNDMKPQKEVKKDSVITIDVLTVDVASQAMYAWSEYEGNTQKYIALPGQEGKIVPLHDRAANLELSSAGNPKDYHLKVSTQAVPQISNGPEGVIFDATTVSVEAVDDTEFAAHGIGADGQKYQAKALVIRSNGMQIWALPKDYTKNGVSVQGNMDSVLVKDAVATGRDGKPTAIKNVKFGF